MPNTTLNGRGLGWKKDLPDIRDHRWSYAQERLPTQAFVAPPTAFDLRPLAPFLNQGNLGSCVANSTSYLVDHELVKSGREPMRLSRLFQYFNTRVLEGTVESDSGSSIRNAIKAVVDWGACPESLWAYETPNFRQRPPETCYQAGATRQVVEYLRVSQSLQELMGAISSGYPVIYGMMIFSQFEQLPSHGIVPLPSLNDRPLGGHSGVLCSYWTDSNGAVYFADKNTWGDNFGAGGYAFFPAQYILDPQLCDDFWIIKSIETDEPPPAPWNIGPDVMAAMVANNHQPVTHEAYKIDENGVSMGWSETIAIDVAGAFWRYTYVASRKRVNVEPM